MPLGSSPEFGIDDGQELSRLDFAITRRPQLARIRSEPFASAPVRSNPRRTYDPARSDRDPFGSYIPMYLSELSFIKDAEWQRLKGLLEEFGREAELFDELTIRQLGRSGSEPFQIQVRRGDGKRKGKMRNLVDVGYGVNQILPVVAELLRQDASEHFLLQQPEVHLHPRAQAALGTLFCRLAGPRKRLIVETHSDHLVDRVRMQVRDGRSKLSPEDVRLLYFERAGGDVKIHELWWDESGNIMNAPAELSTVLHGRSRKVDMATRLGCAILDADSIGEVFGNDESEAGTEFLKWVLDGRLRLVSGGHAQEELRGNTEFRKWAAARPPNLSVYRQRLISTEKEKLDIRKQMFGDVRSNDTHVLALAVVSGSRLLYSRDNALRDDFTDGSIILGPWGQLYNEGAKDSLADRHLQRLESAHPCE